MAFFMFSCNTIPEETRVLAVSDTDAVLVISTPKAKCQNCQKIIEGGLDKVLGVKQSLLNLHTQEVSIVYDPEATTPELLKEKVATLKGQTPCQ